MDRRNFLKNSALTAAGSVLLMPGGLSACNNEVSSTSEKSFGRRAHTPPLGWNSLTYRTI